MGSDNSRGSFDNVVVQRIAPEITFEDTNDFNPKILGAVIGGLVGGITGLIHGITQGAPIVYKL